jgi:hypothetical protein
VPLGFPRAPSNLDFTPAERLAQSLLKAERRPTPARLSVPCTKNDHSHCFVENCTCKICHPAQECFSALPSFASVQITAHLTAVQPTNPTAVNQESTAVWNEKSRPYYRPVG